MGTFLKGLLLLLMVWAAPVGATVYTDLYDNHSGQVGGLWHPYTDWTFDIGQYGFDGSREQITGATLDLSLTDASKDKWFWGYEFALGVTEDEYLGFWEVDTQTRSFDLSSYASLSQKGTLEVALYGLFGEFFLDNALLTVYTQSVPEPGMMSLLAVGLILFGLMGRKRASLR